MIPSILEGEEMTARGVAVGSLVRITIPYSTSGYSIGDAMAPRSGGKAMSCRHDLALGLCKVCYPQSGTVDPGGEPAEPNLDGPGAVPYVANHPAFHPAFHYAKQAVERLAGEMAALYETVRGAGSIAGTVHSPANCLRRGHCWIRVSRLRFVGRRCQRACSPLSRAEPMNISPPHAVANARNGAAYPSAPGRRSSIARDGLGSRWPLREGANRR